MSRKKKPRMEYRYYEVPEKCPVLVLQGEKWVQNYGYQIDYLHFHNLMEIGFCYYGEGTIVLEDEELPYHGGMFTVVPKNFPHTTNSKENSVCSWAWVFVDVEGFTGDDIVKDIVAAAHECGVKVVASNHDFDKTPDKDDIVGRLRKMQDLGADIPKIAVMPQNKKDVLTLLAATEEMSNEYADRPIITMSMAGTGVISRLCGEVFGSALTFGAAKKASAPGQMGVDDLKTVLELLHKSL